MDAHGGTRRIASLRSARRINPFDEPPPPSVNSTPAASKARTISRNKWGCASFLGLNSHDGGAPMPDPDPREQLQLRLRFLAIEANLRTAKRLAHERAETDLLRKRIGTLCEKLEARLH